MANVIKQKVRQVYQFLKEANQLRFRPVRELQLQPKYIRLSAMPNHPAIQLFRPLCAENAQELPDTLLRVRRPVLTKCPPPPQSLVPWLLQEWSDPAKIASVAESQNTATPEEETLTIRFDEDELRVADYAAWLAERAVWAEPELVARRAMAFFEEFYDIYSAIDKDGEELELLIADGLFLWQAVSGVDGPVTVHHPILLKRVELRFDPVVPEFTIHETERDAELYSSLFVDLKEIAPAAIRNRKNELESSGFHPMGWEDTDAFLRAFIQTVSPLKGEYLDLPPVDGATSTPRLYRDMVLLLRKRIAGISNAVDAIIDDIDTEEQFPPSLVQITGTTEAWAAGGFGDSPEEAGGAGNGGEEPIREGIDDEDILLAREANEEQMQIIRRLDHSGSVIVQGPPGTGKTHTIGNLVGHLLAEGKSILVTAQTAKALRVVRDKVPDLLQPLAVSVLGSDQDARRQLESSIGTITERLTGDSAESLLHKARRFRIERMELLAQMTQLTHKLRQAIENEYREIVVGERRYTPSDAARFVSANRDLCSWIPAPVKPGCLPGLSEEELVRLYALGTSYTLAEARDARLPIPDIAILPSEREFQLMVSEYRHLTTTNLTQGANRWRQSGGGSESLEKLLADLVTEFSDDLRSQSWRPYAIVAGIHSGADRALWERLIATIEEAAASNSKYMLVLHHRPELSKEIPIEKQLRIITEILAHYEGGGKLGMLQMATHSEWRQFVRTVSVTSGQPDHRDHFEALLHMARLEHMRTRLAPLWDSMIGDHIHQPFNTLGPTPELSCRAIIPEIWRCLDWHATFWKPFTRKLIDDGLLFDELQASISPEASPISEYLVIQRLATAILPETLITEVQRRKLRECEAVFGRLKNLAAQMDPTSPEQGCTGLVMEALAARDGVLYANAFDYARRLQQVKPLAEERYRLIDRLALVAPGWAEQISNRVPPHNEGKAPGEFDMAWIWRQLYDELAERDRLDAQDLQRQIDRNRELLHQVTQSLIDAKAWGRQLERLRNNPSTRSALVGWLETTKRLVSTRQIDKRQNLLAESKKLMKQCADSVPVWIMPISIVAESFDPRTTRFDVVIIDEASQADLNALIPLYLGKQVIVVGDHEQVTPLGIGKDQTILDNLRRSMLQDIPNSHLFDNQTSIYDIGRMAFGDAIRLVEHFRSVPEIIAFSNQLSYEGKIRPLRESNSTDLKPACVSCRVDGVREGKINKMEAQRIIDTIKAMIRHPRYAHKTIGVISMLGEPQALLIQSMLHKEISGIELRQRRIQAGIAGEFQGDERDIIFLSMVDSPSGEGPLRSTGDGAFEQIKKRYNVAASRARDQMWVVHSFDPDLHLKSSDIRLRLMQHIRDPLATLHAFRQESGKTQSPFEREVLKRLTAAGYKVRSQYPVGYYRIDLVVEGAGKRLAIECDGDRYHTMDNLGADMERQAILERVGKWQFVRIRGSAFYRNPDLAMRPVFERLEELEISPGSNTSDATSADMTLIHELDQLILSGLDKEDVNEEVASGRSGS